MIEKQDEDRFKIYFSGLPKSTCRKSDVYHLFSRFAQIKRVWLSVEKDNKLEVNGAVVKLDRFKLERKKQDLHDKKRKLYNTGNSLRDDFKPSASKSRKGKASPISHSTYNEYKFSKNKFWIDVPHERCCMVTRKKRKRRKLQESYTLSNIQTSKSVHKTKKRKKKKKKKGNFDSLYPESEWFQTVGLLIKDKDEINTTDNTDINTGKEKTCPVSCQMEKENLISGDKPLTHQLNHINGADQVMVSAEKQMNFHESSCKMDLPIPVYVQIAERICLVNIAGDTLKSINEFVFFKEGIPPDIQMVIYQGKILNRTWNPKIEVPYSTVKVLVKGKGGMMASSKSEDEPFAIKKESTENDLKKWLENRVHLPEDVLSKYQGLRDLDGATLLSYKPSDCQLLRRDIEVPIGLARKILLCLDREFIKFWENTKLYTWTLEELYKFVKDSLGDSESSFIIETALKENMIDPMVFVSYQTAEELKIDLDIKSLRGVIFQKLIAKRNILLEDSSSVSTFVKTCNDSAAISNNIKTGLQVQKTEITQPQVAAVSKSTLHKFLEAGLGLLPYEDDVSDFVQCKLFMIYVSFTKVNCFEKKFLFFILCNEGDLSDKHTRTNLWNHIRKNTSLWISELHEKDRALFNMVTNSDDEVLYRGEKVSFSKGSVNSCFLMDKDIEKILNFENHLLLVSQKVLKSNVTHYKCSLSEMKKQRESYCFTMNEKTEFWFFDPDDFSVRFLKRQVAQFRLDYCAHLSSQGDIHSLSDITNNHTSSSRSIYTVDSYPETESPRPFREESDHVLYREKRIITAPESDGTLSERCFEFKYFGNSLKVKDADLTKFVTETLRFGCGVLNSRKNGTIFFGIADSVQQIDGKTYKHGEIVGFPITEEEKDSKTKYTDALRLGINKCFSKDVCSAALQCIGNPVFVRVFTSEGMVPKYVMEVDVCPFSNFCMDNYFKVNLALFDSSRKSKVNEHVLFLRTGSSTCRLTGNEELLFIRTELCKYVKARKEEEQSSALKQNADRERPVHKLEMLFCGSGDSFDPLMWPVFVLSKPSDEQKLSTMFFSYLSFLKKIKNIVAVFDFDDKSHENGLCKLFRNLDESELFDESVFREYSGNFLKLKSILGIPHEEKTIWIFSNGRSDIISEPKPHLQKQEWLMKYQAGISDAVNFFSQIYVIPEGRAMFVFLLFTNELEGIVDTFIDIIVRFSWEQVIILAEKKGVYAQFVQMVTSTGRIAIDRLDDRSVFGVTWEQINARLKLFLGEEENEKCLLPTASGIPMPADERMLESLGDLNVLSAIQCEDKKFLNDKEEKEFAQKEEFRFYKGNRVSWWNFHYEDHVLKRNNFERLKDKVQNVLQSPIKNQRVVVTITLAHEPGAGGSTLAHHILWEFRKKYKCCIIKKITENTHLNLFSLWKFKEADIDKANPLLVLIDELSHTDLRYDELVRKIHTEYRKSPSCPNKPFCCVILCHREEYLKELPANTEILRDQLHQRLTEKEIRWLEDKYKELEKTGKDSGIAGFKPEHLISFMILRTGFNLEFIRNTIKGFLRKLDQHSNEFQLLKYTSLISSYVFSKYFCHKIHIPHDCCDELMGSRLRKIMNPAGWAEYLSPTLNILMVIERKKDRNGCQVRMAHPALAKEVFLQIKEITGQKTSEIASEFLGSPLFKRDTHGRTLLDEMTKEMLKRRQKLEFNDEKTTLFSPLVEDIIEEDNSYENAALLLIKGYEALTDNMIAQTIARLYAKSKQFEEAASWAREAVTLASKSGKCYCIHTLGYVLKEKFLSKTNSLGKVKAVSAIQYLQLAVDALQNFIDAQTGRDSTPSVHVLYPYNDTISIINRITKFLTRNVVFSTDVDVKRYVCDPNYLPQEISEIWKDLHPYLKNLQKFAVDAFDGLEEFVCFNTAFIASNYDEGIVRQRKEHSSYRLVSMSYSSMFEMFSNFFGEDSEEPENFVSEEVKSRWHRRKVLKLGGNSYMNIFSVILDIKKKKLNKFQGLEKLKEIRYNLLAIPNRDFRDFSNLACVNVALGLLDGPRDSEETIYRYCKEIISSAGNAYAINLAHFLISILMWPSSKMKLSYNDDQFRESLKYLYLQSQQKHKERAQKNRSSHFKDDDLFIFQSTTQFFLTKGEGLKSICNKWDIFFREQPESYFDNAVWEKNIIEQKLKRLEGQVHFTKGCVGSFILLENEKSDKPIEIRKLRTGNRNILSQESVTFYLGFSMGGPVAYNIKRKKHDVDTSFEDLVLQENSGIDAPSADIEYMDKAVGELKELVRIIKNLKTRESASLKRSEKKLLENEDDIRAALAIKEGKDIDLLE